MDIFRIQSLIKEGKIVDLADIDPTESYIQIGVFQKGNRQNASANPDAYASYVIPISELVSTPFLVGDKNFIGVDPVYGNNATALADGIYNPNSPFLTISAAVNNATPGDTILLYPGTHTTGTIVNPSVNFYAYRGAIVQNTSGGSVFALTTGTLNIGGEAQFLGTNGPVFSINGASAHIKCDKITYTGSFFGAAYVQTGSNAEISCREVDCRSNSANAFTVEINSTLIVNADIVRYSWIGYNVGVDSTCIINVPKNIQYDLAGDFTQLGNSCVIAANGATGVMVKLNGDMYDEKTSEATSLFGASLNFQNGSGGTIIHNGHRSEVMQITVLRISGSPSAEIILNADITNTQVSGTGGPSGTGGTLDTGIMRIKGRLKVEGGLATDHLINYTGGTLILDDAVLIANPGSESITATGAITYKLYSGYTNRAPNVLVTNAIAGTTLIIDPLIE